MSEVRGKRERGKECGVKELWRAGVGRVGGAPRRESGGSQTARDSLVIGGSTMAKRGGSCVVAAFQSVEFLFSFRLLF